MLSGDGQQVGKLNNYSQREWDRIVGWGKVPPEYSRETSMCNNDECVNLECDCDPCVCTEQDPCHHCVSIPE